MREHDALGLIDQPVVLGMEHVVNRGQADVLVHTAIAGDEVSVQQLVVVFGGAVARVGQADLDIAVGDLADSELRYARCRRGRHCWCEWRRRWSD